MKDSRFFRINSLHISIENMSRLITLFGCEHVLENQVLNAIDLKNERCLTVLIFFGPDASNSFKIFANHYLPPLVVLGFEEPALTRKKEPVRLQSTTTRSMTSAVVRVRKTCVRSRRVRDLRVCARYAWRDSVR